MWLGRALGLGYANLGTLLMVNGIGANTEMWGSAEEILARGSRTIAFDCPGTGRSQTSRPTARPGAVRDGAAVLATFGDSRYRPGFGFLVDRRQAAAPVGRFDVDVEHDRFGPERLCDTPISERGFVCQDASRSVPPRWTARTCASSSTIRP